MPNRYDRQERIPEWNQARINDARVDIVGSGALANYTSAVLAGLGIGHIRIYDNTRFSAHNPQEFLYINAEEGQSKVEALESMLKRINPNIKTRGIHWKFSREYFSTILNNPDVIVDCTNDPYNEMILFKYGKQKGIPVINGSSIRGRGKLTVLDPKSNPFSEEHAKLAEVEGYVVPEEYLSAEHYMKDDDAITSMFVSGVIADEARKAIMPMKEDMALKFPVYYSIDSEKRFGSDDNEPVASLDYDKKKKVAVIGAGSLGNPVALGLAAEGIEEIVIFDDDTVEEVNLNRQILFYDSVGEQKASALAEKLREINPEISIKAFNRKFDGGKFDLIMACTDSFKSRKFANDYCVANKIPLISGGTDFDSGQVVSYIPGKTSCLDCVINVGEFAAKEEHVESCIHEPEPSVIISNWITASLMLGELPAVFGSNNKINGKIWYDSKSEMRVGVSSMKDACNCGGKNG